MVPGLSLDGRKIAFKNVISNCLEIRQVWLYPQTRPEHNTGYGPAQEY